MANELAVLRIPVDGEREAGEWAEFLNAVGSIYSKLAILRIAEQLATQIPNLPAKKSRPCNRSASAVSSAQPRWLLRLTHSLAHFHSGTK
jgi:hypothetical protein